MKLYTSFGYTPSLTGAGYLIHDSDSTQQVVLASPMPSDSNGFMESRFWKRDIWERPRREYINGSWVEDSDFGDSNTLISSRYFWVSTVPTSSYNSSAFDSYNYTDSETVSLFLCRLDSASVETGIPNMWKPVTFNFFMIQHNSANSSFAVDSDLQDAFENWANRDSLFAEPSSIDSALLDAVETVAETFSSRAFVSDSMLSDIDSAVSAGSWDDSAFYDATISKSASLNKLGGVYDTLRNVNLVANLRRAGGFNIDSYSFAEFTFDAEKDSSLQWWSKGPGYKGGETTFYIRLEDSTFDPTDIETY